MRLRDFEDCIYLNQTNGFQLARWNLLFVRDRRRLRTCTIHGFTIGWFLTMFTLFIFFSFCASVSFVLLQIIFLRLFVGRRGRCYEDESGLQWMYVHFRMFLQPRVMYRRAVCLFIDRACLLFCFPIGPCRFGDVRWLLTLESGLLDPGYVRSSSADALNKVFGWIDVCRSRVYVWWYMYDDNSCQLLCDVIFYRTPQQKQRGYYNT